MTSQRESFEKWWNETKGDEITYVGLSSFTEEVMFASWQAAQADQAEHNKPDKYDMVLRMNDGLHATLDIVNMTITKSGVKQFTLIARGTK